MIDPLEVFGTNLAPLPFLQNLGLLYSVIQFRNVVVDPTDYCWIGFILPESKQGLFGCAMMLALVTHPALGSKVASEVP